MNCKPGDLAIVVSGKAFIKYFGRIVVVTNLCNSEMFPFLWHLSESLDGSEGWLLVPDQCLRPIRDTLGEDETLQWAPVPGEKVTA